MAYSLGRPGLTGPSVIHPKFSTVLFKQCKRFFGDLSDSLLCRHFWKLLKTRLQLEATLFNFNAHGDMLNIYGYVYIYGILEVFQIWCCRKLLLQIQPLVLQQLVILASLIMLTAVCSIPSKLKQIPIKRFTLNCQILLFRLMKIRRQRVWNLNICMSGCLFIFPWTLQVKTGHLATLVTMSLPKLDTWQQWFTSQTIGACLPGLYALSWRIICNV